MKIYGAHKTEIVFDGDKNKPFDSEQEWALRWVKAEKRRQLRLQANEI